MITQEDIDYLEELADIVGYRIELVIGEELQLDIYNKQSKVASFFGSIDSIIYSAMVYLKSFYD